MNRLVNNSVTMYDSEVPDIILGRSGYEYTLALTLMFCSYNISSSKASAGNTYLRLHFHHGYRESPTKMQRTNDPLAILGDLEMDLVLSFLSVCETIVIRRVSTLWKARIDFRLTSSAIRRHYPTAEEAQTVYRTRDEEALAFRRVGVLSVYF